MNTHFDIIAHICEIPNTDEQFVKICIAFLKKEKRLQRKLTMQNSINLMIERRNLEHEAWETYNHI
jgi:hypothetical protein